MPQPAILPSAQQNDRRSASGGRSQLPYRLRLPGPVPVPERVRQAIACPNQAHRGPEFRAILKQAEALARPLFGTAGHVLFFASTGTGMMEASLANVLAAQERVLVAVQGQFGERFAAIARGLGADVDSIDVTWGSTIDPADIERRLGARDYRAVVVVHNESSTGQTADLASIGAIVRRHDALLVVDSVSGLGGMEVRQDEWGIDIVVTASQKALMCPPGVGMVSVSPKAWSVIRRDDRLPRFYWDFRKAHASAEKHETAFTSATAIITGLREALTMIHEEGIERVLARHERLSSALRAGCAALGLRRFGAGEALSNTVVAVCAPDGVDGDRIVAELSQKHRTVIGNSRNKLSGRVIRIGTMGALTSQDIVLDLHHLSLALRDLGWACDIGEAIDAMESCLGPGAHPARCA